MRKLRRLHPWDVTPAEARVIQDKLRARVQQEDRPGRLRRVAGVDVGFDDGGRTTRAAVAVLDLASLEPVESAVARISTTFPYVPGLLSFREIPAISAALSRIEKTPDLIICDGQGYAHPRRFGLACHLGVLTGLPTIGVAKTRLIGEHGRVPAGRGRWTPLTADGEVIGAVLRTRKGVKPVFVSVGHRLSLDTAVNLVMRCVTRYRLPETTRAAHRLASG
ncbi:MAG: deoxyribonuclease V [Gammaproteobacteria bacterium]|nr:deoxyribonuclease V [Gammaproteobacteria bacterium]